MPNSVLQLRQQELTTATKPFLARGSKVKRCHSCLLPQVNCLCSAKPLATADAIFVFLMYKGECLKPSNTGRLVADVVKENYAFTWQRTTPNPALLGLLARQDVLPMVVFPHAYAAPNRCISSVPLTSGKKPLFIILDGTWREARKMFSKSSYLHTLPVIAVSPTASSRYLLRISHHDYQLCTAEVAVEILAIAGEQQASQDLACYFADFKQQYIKEKPHKSNDNHDNGKPS